MSSRLDSRFAGIQVRARSVRFAIDTRHGPNDNVGASRRNVIRNRAGLVFFGNAKDNTENA